VLVAGWLNSPHVTAWAEAVAAAGHEVHIAGRAAPQWPPARAAENVHALPFDGLPLLRSLHMSNALAAVAAAVEPDLVHAHFLPEFGWMAARERLQPLVCSAWGSDVLGVRGLARQRSRRALRDAALVLADSKHLARATCALANGNVPIEVVRWGLDLDRFSPGGSAAARNALGLADDGPIVAHVRGLAAVYNPNVLLEAFARVRESHPDVRLLIKHPLKSPPSEVGAAIERPELAEAVDVLGGVPPERMPDVYRAADVVVSIPSRDSSPRSVWEALACGRPVVVSDLPWAREELEPDRQALLAPLDAGAIAAAIARILDDASLSRRLGEGGRALALAELDPQSCAARIDALYRSVVKSVQ
jgi:glycosyltransferase involved in cell wall biosynthesis